MLPSFSGMKQSSLVDLLAKSKRPWASPTWKGMGACPPPRKLGKKGQEELWQDEHCFILSKKFHC